MIEIGTVKQNSVYHFLRHCPYFCYGFLFGSAKEVKLAKPPWELGRGARQRRRGSEWYTNNPANFSTASLQCKFHIKPESIYRHCFIRLITHENTRREGNAMSYTGNFDFFYGMESERYNFISIPKLLMKDQRFSYISAGAKLMCGLLLDRNSLSQKNGWLDAENRVYIIYTIEEMKKDFGCTS